MRALPQLATWCTTVATTAVAITAAPAVADPSDGTYQPIQCIWFCLTWGDNPNGPYMTASSPLDVTRTPYWITIFNARNGWKYTSCASGTECVTSLPSAFTCDPVIAYIGSNTATMPPREVLRTTGVVQSPYYNLC